MSLKSLFTEPGGQADVMVLTGAGSAQLLGPLWAPQQDCNLEEASLLLTAVTGISYFLE